MVYRNMIQSGLLAPLLLTGLLLTGCGGASSESAPTNNKPGTPASIAASSTAQSSDEASSLGQSSDSSATSTSADSSVQYSQASSYARISRSSTSSTASSVDLIDEIIIPTEPEDVLDLPPNAPTNLKTIGASSKEISIEWTASTDDNGIVSYEIRRNGVYIGSSNALKTSFVDTGLSSNTSYIYTVRAADTIGHRSRFSDTLSAKTLPEASSTSSSAIINSSKSSSQSSSNQSSSSQSSKSDHSSKSDQSSSSRSSTPSESFNVAWQIPKQREDGSYLELHEIGGYELRYKIIGSDTYVSTLVGDSNTTSYHFSKSAARDSIEVAAFDINGLYSRFINLTPR
jgi:hypothetical protein